MIQKLENFPQVYYLSFETSKDRRIELESQFKTYEIENFKSIITTPEMDTQSKVSGPFLHQLDKPTLGCAMSHLRALKEWYNNCDEPQVLFLEDDVSLETIKYWNFSWDELIVKFPKDFDCIQLLCIRENLNEIKFRKRYWDDWAATAYLIKREYVKRVLDQYYPNDEFLLTIPYGRIIPLVENIIFGLGNTYVIPLFIENINFISTFFERSIKEQHKANHLESSLFVFNWWQTNKNENQLKLLFD